MQRKSDLTPRAALVSVNLETGEVHSQVFDGKDAIQKCQSFRDAIGDDFSDCEWGIIANEAAKKQYTDWYLGEAVEVVNG